MNLSANIKKEYKLNGLSCAMCADKIKQGLNALEGVDSANIDIVGQRLVLNIAPDYSGSLFEGAQAVVKKYEPDASIIDETKDVPQQLEEKKSFFIRYLSAFILGFGALLFAAGLIFDFSLPVKLGVLIASYLLIGGKVIIKALKNISMGQVFDENFLMLIASAGAFAIGEHPEGIAVMLFYRIGEAFQNKAVDKSRRSISALLDIRPDSANLLDADGNYRIVSPEEVGVGDIILVKPGERIPIDGTVVSGSAATDASALTGESIPRYVEPGSGVFSGSINKNGLLTIRTSKLFAESAVSRILELVENAGENKAVMENLITKLARYYTPAVVFCAAALAVFPPLFISGAVFSDWLHRSLVFLVISCPCALVISIPLGFFGGIGGASRKGILVKGGNYLEALNNVDTVVFDKTGTLTKGIFEVKEVSTPADGLSDEELLYLAACAENHSNHSIALAIQRAYGGVINASELTEHEEIAGMGVSVKLGSKSIRVGKRAFIEVIAAVPEKEDLGAGTYVYVAIDDSYAGSILIADSLKDDSLKAVKDLRDVGVRQIIMLSGDGSQVAYNIGEQLGLDEVYADMLPEDKVERLEFLEKRRGSGRIAFVGDGINDAPALARSDIGIAMGGLGADAAIEVADVVIMTDEPSKVAVGIRIAKKTHSIVLQNVVFALAVKAVLLVLGALGFINMWMAVFGDVGVAIIAIFNAMRSLIYKEAQSAAS